MTRGALFQPVDERFATRGRKNHATRDYHGAFANQLRRPPAAHGEHPAREQKRSNPAEYPRGADGG